MATIIIVIGVHPLGTPHPLLGLDSAASLDIGEVEKTLVADKKVWAHCWKQVVDDGDYNSVETEG